jgi:hypothetical protein
MLSFKVNLTRCNWPLAPSIFNVGKEARPWTGAHITEIDCNDYSLDNT